MDRWERGGWIPYILWRWEEQTFTSYSMLGVKYKRGKVDGDHSSKMVMAFIERILQEEYTIYAAAG